MLAPSTPPSASIRRAFWIGLSDSLARIRKVIWGDCGSCPVTATGAAASTRNIESWENLRRVADCFRVPGPSVGERRGCQEQVPYRSSVLGHLHPIASGALGTVQCQVGGSGDLGGGATRRRERRHADADL